MKIGLRLIIFWKHLGTHPTSLINSTFGKQHHCLAKLGIGSLRDEEGRLQMGAQLALQRLYLDLDTTGTDHIILPSQNAEAPLTEFRDVVGNQAL